LIKLIKLFTAECLVSDAAVEKKSLFFFLLHLLHGFVILFISLWC